MDVVMILEWVLGLGGMALSVVAAYQLGHTRGIRAQLTSASISDLEMLAERVMADSTDRFMQHAEDHVRTFVDEAESTLATRHRGGFASPLEGRSEMVIYLPCGRCVVVEADDNGCSGIRMPVGLD